jgi:hypothetical protein
MADAWYFFDGARQLGPFSLVELRRLLDIQSSPMVRVWREGLAEWTRPAGLPEFGPARLPPLPLPLPPVLPQGQTQDSRGAIAEGRSRFNNFIAKNWRGEFPLATTYWVFGFLGNLAAGALAVGIVAAFQQNESFQPATIFASILLAWLVVTGVAIWQSVGVWRSANRHSSARTLSGKSLPGQSWRKSQSYWVSSASPEPSSHRARPSWWKRGECPFSMIRTFLITRYG